jgi:hypothetical protein
MAEQSAEEEGFGDALLTLCYEVIIGSLVFVVIALPAVALEQGIHYMDKFHMAGPFLKGILTHAKYAALVIDLTLYLSCLFYMGLHFIRSLRAIQ